MNERLPKSALTIIPIHGLPEVEAGQDLAALIVDAFPELQEGDVLVVTSKIVSKAEDRLVGPFEDRNVVRPDLIEQESVRLVAKYGGVHLVVTHEGFVLSHAGIDRSNIKSGYLALLPIDSQESAERIRSRICELTGLSTAVIISDTMGRPWRRGLIDHALGVAGMSAFRSNTGMEDPFGHPGYDLSAVADEIASAADIVKGKYGKVPVVVVRGVPSSEHDDQGLRGFLTPDDAIFPLGTAESMRAAVTSRKQTKAFRNDHFPEQALVQAVEAALVAESTGNLRRQCLRLQDHRAQVLGIMKQCTQSFEFNSQGKNLDLLNHASELLLLSLCQNENETQSSEFSTGMLAGAFLQDTLIALHAVGAGASWWDISPIAEQLTQSLDLPSNQFLFAIVAVGYDQQDRLIRFELEHPPLADQYVIM